jgi:tetratricopeptide (TPR) repeat protein
MMIGEANVAQKMTYMAVVAGAIALFSFVPAASADEVVLALSPNPLELCANLAAKAETTGAATDRSLAVCGQAVERAKGTRDELAAAYINRSVIHLARLEYDAALADSDASMHIKSGLPQALINRGIALSAEGRNKEANEAFTGALALAPSHPAIIYFDRALTREDLGDLKGAYLDYRKAAQLDPTWDTPKQQLARFTVAHSPTS